MWRCTKGAHASRRCLQVRVIGGITKFTLFGSRNMHNFVLENQIGVSAETLF